MDKKKEIQNTLDELSIFLNAHTESRFDDAICCIDNMDFNSVAILANNSKTPIYYLKRILRNRRSIHERALAIKNPNISDEYVIEMLNSICTDSQKDIFNQRALFQAAAEKSSISVRTLEWIVDTLSSNENLSDDDVRIAVADNPNSTPEILRKVYSISPPQSKTVYYFDHNVYESIGKNPNTPLDIVYDLLNHERDGIRIAAASNKALPQELIHKYAYDMDLHIRCGIAMNESTSVMDLIHLSKEKNSNVKAFVVKNKNTPEYILKKLYFEYECVGVEDENGREGDYFKESLAANPTTPKEILENLIRTEKDLIKENAISNPSIDGQFLIDNIDHFNLVECSLIGSRLDFNPKNFNLILNTLLEKVEREDDPIIQVYVDYFIREVLARLDFTQMKELIADTNISSSQSLSNIQVAALINPNVPRNLLEVICKSENRNLLKAVAANKSLPIENIEMLAESNSVSVRKSIAKNTSTPVSVLKRLAKDSEQLVRLEVAQNENVDTSTLSILANDKDAKVRKAVASSKKVSETQLALLAEEEGNLIKEAVAKNTSTPQEILEDLSFSNYASVRKEVAANPSTPDYILSRLSRDYDEEVITAVASNDNISSNTLSFLWDNMWHSNSISWTRLQNLVSNAKFPVDILESFGRSDDINKRGLVVRSPNTPSWILLEIAKAEHINGDQLNSILDAIAINPSSTTEILEYLLDKGPSNTIYNVSRNPNITEEIASRLFDVGSESIYEELLKNPSTPKHILEKVFGLYGTFEEKKSNFIIVGAKPLDYYIISHQLVPYRILYQVLQTIEI